MELKKKKKNASVYRIAEFSKLAIQKSSENRMLVEFCHHSNSLFHYNLNTRFSTWLPFFFFFFFHHIIHSVLQN